MTRPAGEAAAGGAPGSVSPPAGIPVIGPVVVDVMVVIIDPVGLQEDRVGRPDRRVVPLLPGGVDRAVAGVIVDVDLVIAAGGAVDHRVLTPPDALAQPASRVIASTAILEIAIFGACSTGKRKQGCCRCQ